jgi:hypothetical protein
MEVELIMTVEECYGFWRYTVRVYCLYFMYKDSDGEGKEIAKAWYSVLKEYPRQEIYDAFQKAFKEFPNAMPGIPVILDYIRIARKREKEREEMRRQAEERRQQEELEKDPAYQKQNAENMARLRRLMKGWSDAVSPNYLKTKDK